LIIGKTIKIKLFYLATPTNNDIKRSENELQQNLAVLTSQCAQLNEANRAWQQFHQTQLDNFRNKLQNSLPIDNTFSFDEIAQLISDHIHQLVNQRDTLIQNLNTTEKLYSDRQNGKTLSLRYDHLYFFLRANQ
jgi:hypothetical protein